MPRAPQSRPGNIYTDLSVYYDLFCAEVDYVEQCAFAQRAFTAFTQTNGRDYLDLACGSGQHLLTMQAYGFVPHGLDNSSEMLALAAARCPAAQLQLCDLAAFEQQAAFDLITCFLYSIHYSHPLAALRETLARSFAALKPGGVLLFNAVDARGIKNDAGITTHLNRGDEQLRFSSAWHYRGEGEVLDLKLDISRHHPEGVERWQDQHRMTALVFSELEAALQALGFEVHILEHDYSTLRSWDGESFNAVFVACKPQA
ncbi:MAG TPA: class I SAM-dependent methyltransferase [Pseudomonadaceae bacterium]|nr:class I SAM-dependent methyltransferase [Pseudomonadaceae bacterium]